MSIWIEIRNDFEDEGVTHIDGWLSKDDNEEGTTIARVYTDTKSVEYIDQRARTDSYAQEMIKEVIF